VELIVVGVLILLIAAAFTALNCDPADTRRVTDESFNAFVCPDTPVGARGPAPPYAFLFSRIFVLWLLGAGTLLAGIGLGLRDWLRGRESVPATHPEREDRKPQPPPPPVDPQPSFRETMHRKTQQRPSEPMAALRFDLRQAVDAGDLDAAIALGEQAVADNGDPVLIEAAQASLPADVDWIEVAAAAIIAGLASR
jgi:hypothetical protein